MRFGIVVKRTFIIFPYANRYHPEWHLIWITDISNSSKFRQLMRWWISQMFRTKIIMKNVLIQWRRCPYNEPHRLTSRAPPPRSSTHFCLSLTFLIGCVMESVSSSIPSTWLNKGRPTMRPFSVRKSDYARIYIAFCMWIIYENPHTRDLLS